MRIWKTGILFYIGGMVYVLLEWLWRGWSHPSMFLLGGLCFVLLGLLNELDEDARALLTHDLRTDDWMNGPLTAVPEDTAAGWPVEEEQKQ